MICNICKKEIHDKERYVRLTQFAGGEELSTGYYHNSCFREKFMEIGKLKKDAGSLVERTKKLLTRMESSE